MAKNKNNKAQNNAEFAEELNQNNAAGKQAAKAAQQRAEK